MSDSTYTSPAEGESAPDFTLFTDDQMPWRLSEHLNSPVVLLFFPGAFTSVCTTELNRANHEFNGFGEAHVVGLSTDSPFVLSEFRDLEQFGFPLLSDHDAEVCARYGAKYDENFTGMNLDRIAKRAAFVVDRGGVVRYAEVLENAGRQPDLGVVSRAVNRLA